MYYLDKNGNKIDGKTNSEIKENYSSNTNYSLYIYLSSVFICLILAFTFKDKISDINISLLPSVSKDTEKIIIYGIIIGLLLGLIINYSVYGR